MSKTTGISWTDSTFNPWIGCEKVSAGCTNCYAERDNKRFQWVEGGWGTGNHRKLTGDSYWKKPLVWNKEAEKTGIRQKVFCASLGDVFEDRPVLINWRTSLFKLVKDTPNLDWLILTKRPENVLKWGYYYLPKNVWMGVTAENQEMADKRIPLLLDIPASIRFISVEPMLGVVDLTKYIDELDWVICGGESGPTARPMMWNWAKSLQIQCEYADVPYFFKQVGGNKRIDGKWGGDLLGGKQYHEFPRY